MSIKNLFILLFLSLVTQVILDDVVIDDKEEYSIKDFQTSFFNTKPEAIYYLGSLFDNATIVAFADLNNDKLTDIITYIKENSTTFAFYVHEYTNKDEPKFLERKQLFKVNVDQNMNETKDIRVRNLHVGSFFEDNPKQYYFLITFEDEEEDEKHLVHYIISEDQKDKYNGGTFLKDMTDSNILILNKDENKGARFLYSFKDSNNNESYTTRICKLKKTNTNFECDNDNFEDYIENIDDNDYKNYSLYLSNKLSLKGGLAYVDLSGNCVPDIVLTHDIGEKRYIEFYIFHKGKNKYALKNIIELPNNKEYGAFVVTKINDEKSETSAPLLDILIPKVNKNQVLYLKNQKTIGYKWSQYYCLSFQDNKDKLYDLDKSEIFSLTINNVDDEKVRLDTSFPTVMRVGDFLGTSNPGILVKQNILKDDKETIDYSQISLFKREGGEFKYFAGVNTIKEQKKEFTMGLFFDIDESGTLSLILPSTDGKNHFFFNYKRSIYFLKSKLMNDKKLYYDTNLGATFRYIVTDKKGDRHMDISYQMTQTSDMNIPLPYSLMGLDDTNNYVEYFESISGNYLDEENKKVIFVKEEEKNRKGNSPIIPNTQMMISKYYNKDDKIEWNVDLIVQPMDKIWLFLLIVIIVLIIVLSFIIYLHVKELKEEQKETTKFKSWFA